VPSFPRFADEDQLSVEIHVSPAHGQDFAKQHASEQCHDGIRMKAPKSRAGRGDIGLPEIVVDTLHEDRLTQLELRVADKLGLPEITLHGLRYTPASQLIDAGVAIVTISKRLGHASPDVTLRVYAHLFRRDDDKAAAAINAALAGAGGS
jgi:integrase